MAELAVETKQGVVRGELHGDVRIWKGIPYAAPPVGAGRFRPPLPPVPWQGERAASKFGSVAAQSRDPHIAILSGISDKVTSGEDSLVLNVFAPLETDIAGSAPVVVWIHGGAFVMGSGSTPLYSGEPFAADGIVVVTLNYRLGIPGLLYLGDLLPGYEAGNYALLDQVAALRWVRDNIAAFGGDPARVTIMGESAGAISIAYLLAMPEARGLFQRAILESGGPPLIAQTRADATKLTEAVLAELGTTAEHVIELPIERLIAAQEKLAKRLGIGAFAPYVDGVTVREPPIQAIRNGSAAGIPLLLGSNHNEWALFQVFLGDVTVDSFKAPLANRLGPALAPLLAVYRAAEPRRTEQDAWVDLLGDLVFRIPMVRLAEAQAAQGAPVFVYRFDWRSPQFGGRLGAAHALELPFVWNRLDLPTSPILLGNDIAAIQPLATAIHNTWSKFIMTGEPNDAGLPAWPHYSAERRSTLLIDKDARVVDDPGSAARILWPELG